MERTFLHLQIKCSRQDLQQRRLRRKPKFELSGNLTEFFVFYMNHVIKHAKLSLGFQKSCCKKLLFQNTRILLNCRVLQSLCRLDSRGSSEPKVSAITGKDFSNVGQAVSIFQNFLLLLLLGLNHLISYFLLNLKYPRRNIRS